MPSDLPRLFLARHGDTAWTVSRQHTGRTDLALNAAGEGYALQLGERMRRFAFARVFTSPLRRASKTCELAGFGAVAEVDPDLVEWDYGHYEGKKTPEILGEGHELVGPSARARVQVLGEKHLRQRPLELRHRRVR